MRLKVFLKRGIVKDGEWAAGQIMDEKIGPKGINVAFGEQFFEKEAPITGLQIIIEEDANDQNNRRSIFDSDFYRRSDRLFEP